MTSYPKDCLAITSDTGRSSRGCLAWHWNVFCAFGALVIAGCLLGWMGWESWRSARREGETLLKAELEERFTAIDRWYRSRQERLAVAGERIAEAGDLNADLTAFVRKLGFEGYILVGREGRVLSGDKQVFLDLQHEFVEHDLVRNSLSGKTTSTGIQKRFNPGRRDELSDLIGFSAPIWLKKEPKVATDLALPDAGIVAWVSARGEFLPQIASAKFGETGQVREVADDKKIFKGSGIDWGRNFDSQGQPLVRAFCRGQDENILLNAEIAQREVFAPFYRALWPILGLATLVAICSGLLVTCLIRGFLRSRRPTVRSGELSQIGQYIIEEAIGEGGMGIVFRARHQLMRRPAAIKLLDRNHSDVHSIARFEREVQLTALLSHPNTVAIYDYGLTDSGEFYYAMEYLEGVSLDTLVLDGPLSECRAIHLLAQLCGSLHEAHQVGLIHRDIKPANVLVTERGGLFDFVKLLDFGLVKAVRSNAVHITSDGASVGTPLFMSPEAIETPEDVDARSDLYSVGAIGYYLLTGKFVFIGKSSTEVCMKHLREQPIPLSKRGPRTISPDLEHLILQCLEKDRDQRPPTALALQQSLLACREAFTWTEDEAAGWWSERRNEDQSQEFTAATAG